MCEFGTSKIEDAKPMGGGEKKKWNVYVGAAKIQNGGAREQMNCL